jgi:hypothetical protein
MSARTLLRGLIVVLLVLHGVSAVAAVAKLDDTTSAQHYVTPQRIALTPAQGLNDGFSGSDPTGASLYFGRVNYRLATSPYVGKRARIYFVIPPASQVVTTPAALTVEWRGARVLASGSGHPGDRVMVWQGVVTSPWLADDVELTMHIDLRHLQSNARTTAGFESYFEIEVSQ